MPEVSRSRWTKFLSPLLITAIILTSLAVFPSGVAAFSASLDREGEGSLGGDQYLLGEWVVFNGSVAFADGEVADIEAVTFIVDGPEALTMQLPVDEGTYEYLDDSLIVTVTWSNMTVTEVGYGYSIEGGSGGGSIDYMIQWRPSYMLSSPDAELPETDLAWDMPDVSGMADSQKVQGMAYDETNLYLLVDGTDRDLIIKTDLDGNLVDSFNAPSRNTRAITYLDGYLYVYADNYQRIFDTVDEEPQYEDWNNRYRLSIADNWDYQLVSGTLVVTVDGEVTDVTYFEPDRAFEIDTSGIWDTQKVLAPSVVKVDSTFHMWYYSDAGLGGMEKIGHATSADGVDWTKDSNNPVLTPGDVGAWDSAGVLHPSVVYDSANTTFHMWYIGYSDTGRHVGHATSADGVDWTKDADNPVLSPGDSGAWDDLEIGAMDVIAGGPGYQMWYSATGSFDFVSRIGYASSTDGVTWDKLEANPQNLSNNVAADSQPSWSPDGTQVAFVRDGDIWLMNADGSGQTVLVGTAATEQDPAWCPSDGNKIAYASDTTGNFEIWVVDLTDAENPVQVTFRLQENGQMLEDTQPTWSPDGAMIAFVSNDAWGGIGDYDVWIINSDGSNERKTYDSWNCSDQLAWSPNGSWIAFHEGTDIQIMQLDGFANMTNCYNITNNMANDRQPAWSSDSSQIIFTSDRTGDDEIWVLQLNPMEPWNTPPPSQVTNNPASAESDPAFVPDSSLVSFVSDRSGDDDIWTTDTVCNPVLEPNDWGFDEDGVSSPTVVYDGTKYRMWYEGNGWNEDRGRIGYATSDDGLDWNKPSNDPVLEGDMMGWDENGVNNPEVVKVDTAYKMWYDGKSFSSETAIGLATSFNGASWAKNANNPVLEEGMRGATVLASYSYTQGWERNSIVKVDATDGSYVDDFESPNQEQLGGLDNDGTDLLACRNQWGGDIYNINPDDGSWNSSWLNSDKGYWIDGGSALCYIDGDLYLAYAGDVFVIDMDSCNIYDRYQTGLSSIGGLALIGEALYIGAGNPGAMYQGAMPGTVEKTSIGDYEACLDVDGGTTSAAVAFTLERLDEAVDVLITSPEDGYASDEPEIEIAGSVNDPSIDYVQIGIELPSTQLVNDDMENGDSNTGEGSFQKQNVNGEGWMPYSPDNLWHLTDQRSYSGGFSWGYNRADGFGFNTPGQANAGAIVSEPFNIGEDCELTFATSWDTDSWAEVDRKLIDIYVDGQWQPLAYIVDGDWYPDFFGGSRQRIIVPMAWMWKDTGDFGPVMPGDSGWNWYDVSIDLGAFAGASDAQVRFRFDTMDDWMNDFEGWYIDDVTVSGAGFQGINVEVVDLAFSTSYMLAEGYNDITVSAQSAYITGEEGRDAETVTVSLDTTGPTISFDPLEPSTNQGSIEVSGTVYELNFDNLVVSINDKPFYTLSSIPDGQEAPVWTFSTQVPLFEGENVIVATGTDAAGLTGSDTITIIRDSTPPTIDVLPTVYFVGETAARPGDLLIFQLDAVDESPEGTEYEPAGVQQVLLGTPGNEDDYEWFIPSEYLPEAVADQWGTTGAYVFPMVIPDDAPPGSYSMTVTAIDNAGNTSTSTVTALIVSTLSAYNIYLMPGWNLISLPLIPDDSDIDNLLGSVTGVESVWYYDAATAEWLVYTTSDAPDSLTTMETGKGYWVYMNEEAFEYSAPLDYGLPQTPAPIKFSYTGQVLEPASVPPTYNLQEGWNLIGLHSERSQSVSLYLRPVTVPQQVWASLLQYDNYISFQLGDMEKEAEEGEGGAEIYLGCFKTLLETDEMDPGKGFWVYLVEPGKVVAQP